MLNIPIIQCNYNFTKYKYVTFPICSAVCPFSLIVQWDGMDSIYQMGYSGMGCSGMGWTVGHNT